MIIIFVIYVLLGRVGKTKKSIAQRFGPLFPTFPLSQDVGFFWNFLLEGFFYTERDNLLQGQASFWAHNGALEFY